MKLLVWGFQMSCAGHQWHYGTINPSQTSHDAHKLATRLYSTKYLWKPLSLFAFMAPISMLQAVSVITCIRTIESTWRNSLTPLQHSTRKNKKVSKCGEYKKAWRIRQVGFETLHQQLLAYPFMNHIPCRKKILTDRIKNTDLDKMV